jgi:hypothetical protein
MAAKYVKAKRDPAWGTALDAGSLELTGQLKDLQGLKLPTRPFSG